MIGAGSQLGNTIARVVATVGPRRLKNFGGVLGANALNNIVSFVATVYVARVLGASLFGRVGIGVSIVVIGSLVFDLGLGIALLRQHPRLGEKLQGSLEVGVVGLKCILVLVSWIAAPQLAVFVVRAIPIMAGHEVLVRLSIVSGALLSLWNSLRSIEQARMNFSAYRNWTLAYAMFRAVAFAGAAIWLPKRTEALIVGIYFLPLLLLAALYAGPLLLRRSKWAFVEMPVVVLAALRYGLWVAVSAIAFAVLARLPQFSLSFSGTEEVGLYSAALTFLALFSMLNQSVRALLVPDVAALEDESARSRFRARARQLMPTYFAGATGSIVALVLIQWLVLGGDYVWGIPAFVAMAIGTVVTIYFGLLNTLVHSHGVPQVDTLMSLGRCAILGLALYLIPLNAFRAGLSFALVLVGGELAVYLYMHRRERTGSSLSLERRHNAPDQGQGLDQWNEL